LHADGRSITPLRSAGRLLHHSDQSNFPAASLWPLTYPPQLAEKYAACSAHNAPSGATPAPRSIHPTAYWRHPACPAGYAPEARPSALAGIQRAFLPAQ